MSFDPIVWAIILSALSGLPSAFMMARSRIGQQTATACMLAAMGLGLFGAVSVLLGGAAGPYLQPDALSAFFLVPVFLAGGMGSVYGLGYWKAEEHPGNARKLQVFWGLLPAGMAMLVVAKNAAFFLLGWEIMALSAFFLVSTEDEAAESRKAAWVYFIATHIGTLTLFGLFAFWRHKTGSFAFTPAAGNGIGAGALNALFFLALVGFGLKAGIMPLHFWLPGAHAASPSHVSAVLSGVVLKMGVYGLMRWVSLLPAPPAAWGSVLLVLGAAGGLLGILFAIGQRDLKRLLAYSSVENIGIILMAFALAVLGKTYHRPEWIALGLAGALLHVWNHSFFKVLLFMTAGSVVHGAGTRQMDKLGGMAKRMPFTAGMFLLGSLAVCALPPLNGFISELLLYLALMQGSLTIVAAPILATIGALALTAFVKAYGAVFLGAGRTEAAGRAHEAPAAMRAAMVPFALLCVAAALAPEALAPFLDRIAAAWAGPDAGEIPRLASLLPLGVFGRASLAVAAAGALCVGAAALAVRSRRRRALSAIGTWDCGYAAPDARMQYTGSSFVQPLVVFFAWLLRPRTRKARISGFFPGRSAMRSKVDDAVLDRALLPISRKAERRFRWIHRFQQGLTQHYLLYMFITVLVLLGSLIPLKDVISRVFTR